MEILATIANNERGGPRVQLAWDGREIVSRPLGGDDWEGNEVRAASRDDAIEGIRIAWGSDPVWDLEWSDGS